MEELQVKKSVAKSISNSKEYSLLNTKEEKKEFIQQTFRKITVDPVRKLVIECEMR